MTEKRTSWFKVRRHGSLKVLARVMAKKKFNDIRPGREKCLHLNYVNGSGRFTPVLTIIFSTKKDEVEADYRRRVQQLYEIYRTE